MVGFVRPGHQLSLRKPDRSSWQKTQELTCSSVEGLGGSPREGVLDSVAAICALKLMQATRWPAGLVTAGRLPTVISFHQRQPILTSL
jgi:hypothetical protein